MIDRWYTFIDKNGFDGVAFQKKIDGRVFTVKGYFNKRDPTEDESVSMENFLKKELQNKIGNYFIRKLK